MWAKISDQVERLKVAVCNDRESNREWEFVTPDNLEIDTLPGREIRLSKYDTSFYFQPDIVKLLIKEKPDCIVITGYENATYIMALIVAKMFKIPLVQWWGSHSASGVLNSSWTKKIKTFILKRFDAYVTYGSAATEYLVEMGIEPSKIVTSRNAIDLGEVDEIKVRNIRSDVYNRPSGTERIVKFLYVGQIIDRKGIFDLLNAFYKIDDPNIRLKILGSGELLDKMTEAINKMGDTRVEYVGKTKSFSETQRFLLDSDVVIVPSKREVWGLVINEALSCGNFVITNNSVGAGRDLISEKTGIIYNYSDEFALQHSIYKAIDEIRSGKFNYSDSLKAIKDVTVERYASDIIRASRVATRNNE
ncbi:glycosyltransferase family 4 protein [Deinococcus knuensis]|uniref:Glycosyltransferase n=1 Tax=Deinococcus knuensis TaxID=1837380 RepID=A0ABQ2SHE7_9DEIO|nr:glycosyltransferase family 4 protein [Deinococcus knuensis]GGS26077.1 hypothetical protein GCM10008961_16990 [Deinococcus knuensis]